jgi:hypothetical protein
MGLKWPPVFADGYDLTKDSKIPTKSSIWLLVPIRLYFRSGAEYWGTRVFLIDGEDGWCRLYGE